MSRVGGGSAFYVRTHGDAFMNIPTSKKERLDLMSAIVSSYSSENRDTQPVRDIIDLAYGFEGMTKRRERLILYLRHIRGLKQQSAIDKWWSKIHETVFEFSSEIMDARSSGSAGGSGYQ